jgi:hypothetical protein
MTNNENQLSYLDDKERLQAYQTIVNGCSHLWSKGTLQKDRLKQVLDIFMELSQKDPYFLAHFTSYAVTKIDSKDLKVVSVFANSLSDADGTPFSQGSTYNKPNLRIVSQAALQHKSFDPKLAARVIEIATTKQTLGSKYKEGTHFSRQLKTAIKKYVKYREQNPKALEGIRKVGLSKRFQILYRYVHIIPTYEAASILGWKQKKGPAIQKTKVFDFKGMSDLEIAQKIRDDKLPPTGVLGALPEKVSPVIAAAILEQATGDQAVILRELFDSQGLLKHAEVKKIFTEKIKQAKTALDRVERINTEIDEDIQKELKQAKSTARKEAVGDIGKIFLHIDISGSMESAITVAKDRGAIIAECVNNPQENFFWGVFNGVGSILIRPDTFEKDAFTAKLYGMRCSGNTDCLALYEYARKQKCDVDVYITDEGHNVGDIKQRIELMTSNGIPKPKAAVIIHVGGACSILKKGLEEAGIPVSIMDPNTLIESALVSQAVKTALKGATAIIEEIMQTPLLKLPEWWNAVQI